jgi:hypothetical protein
MFNINQPSRTRPINNHTKQPHPAKGMTINLAIRLENQRFQIHCPKESSTEQPTNPDWADQLPDKDIWH